MAFFAENENNHLEELIEQTGMQEMDEDDKKSATPSDEIDNDVEDIEAEADEETSLKSGKKKEHSSKVFL